MKDYNIMDTVYPKIFMMDNAAERCLCIMKAVSLC